jgi:hypothetical protein
MRAGGLAQILADRTRRRDEAPSIRRRRATRPNVRRVRLSLQLDSKEVRASSRIEGGGGTPVAVPLSIDAAPDGLFCLGATGGRPWNKPAARDVYRLVFGSKRKSHGLLRCVRLESPFGVPVVNESHVRPGD